MSVSPSKSSVGVSTPSVPADFKPVIADVISKIKQYTDKGRNVSALFQVLPDRTDYPDYYELIKNPISISQMEEKLSSNQYKTLAEFQSDFDLMVQNATTYNRKHSFVWKDAILLKSVFDELLPPLNPPNSIKINISKQAGTVDFEELKNIIKKLSAHKDADNYALADIFQELPSEEDYPDYYDEIQNPIALDMIKRKISNKVYKDVKEFEADLMLMFNNARRYNAEGSAVYDDANTLQDLLFQLLGKKAPMEEYVSAVNTHDTTEIEVITHNDVSYSVGDYVYVKNFDNPKRPTVVQIESVWVKNSGSKMQGFSGCWYLRPEQTVHKAQMKFMDNEVFKTNRVAHYSVQEIQGKCMVLFVRDYIKGKPRGFEMKDVYVCEQRYTEQGRHHSKIKAWAQCLPEKVRSRELDLELYPTPLVPNRSYGQLVSEADLPSNNRKRKHSEVSETKAVKPVIAPIPQRAAPSRNASIQPLQALAHQQPQLAAKKNIYPTWGGITGSNPNAPFLNTQINPSAEVLPAETVQLFDTTADKKLKWFPAPPVSVLAPNEPIVHSIDYLLHKRQKKDAPSVAKPSSPQRVGHGVVEKKRPENDHGIFANILSKDNGEIQKEVSAETYWGPVTEILNDLCDIWFPEDKSKSQVKCQ